MPLPLIPIIGWGIAAIASGVGVKKGVDAVKLNSEAKQTNLSATGIVKESEKSIKSYQEATRTSIENLGRAKIEVLSSTIMDFVTYFEQIKEIELLNTEGIEELKDFSANSEDFLKFKTAAYDARNVAINGVSAIAAGTLLAYGTYSVVMSGLGGVLVTATTGTALASLSGAVAVNATLAWLGGGALSIGGLGMAGGAAVLGGLVAGPALALGGVLFASQAKKALYNARGNLQEAKKYKAQSEKINAELRYISFRAEEMTQVLQKLNKLFKPMVEDLSYLVRNVGRNWSDYSEKQKQSIYQCVETAQVIKSILDVELLSEEGKLNESSNEVLQDVKNYCTALPQGL